MKTSVIVFQCKQCGGNLSVKEGDTLATCESCGATQTLPSTQDEHIRGFFFRANGFRLKNAFDKAAGLYETILQEDPTQAEAYWGALLCEYGIEYVLDPESERRVPTCHRLSYTPIQESENYAGVLKYADGRSQVVYQQDAEVLEKLRKSVAVKAKQAQPVDIFICYKESEEGDASRRRTLDSELAGSLYDDLTEAGFKVFFARESLKEYSGEEYEPYIFAALHSAKVMLVVATSRKHIDATWVKNEWSRYLALMDDDPKTKRRFVPCIKNMEPEDLPDRFARYECADLGEPGAQDDLVRALKKVLRSQLSPSMQQSGMPSVQSLLNRGWVAAGLTDWMSAESAFDKVLNLDAKCAEAYLGLICAKQTCSTRDAWATLYIEKGGGENNPNFRGFLQNVQGELQEWWKEVCEKRKKKLEEDRKRAEEERRRREEERKKREAEEAEARARRLAAEAKARALREAAEAEARAKKEAEQRRRRAEARRQDAEARLSAQLETLLARWYELHNEAVAASDFLHAGTKYFSAVCWDADTNRFNALACPVDGSGQPWQQSDVAALLAFNALKVTLSFGGILSIEGWTGREINVPADIRAIAGSEHCLFCVTSVERQVQMLDFADTKKGWVTLPIAHCARLSVGANTVTSITKDGEWTILSLGNGEPVYTTEDKPDTVISCAIGEKFVLYLRKYGDWGFLGKPPPGADTFHLGKDLDVVAIAAGKRHAVFLTMEGQVYAIGDNKAGQCKVEDWPPCSAILAGDNYTVALTREGRLLCTNPLVARAFEGITFPVKNWEKVHAGMKQQSEAVLTQEREALERLQQRQTEIKNWLTLHGRA